MVLFFLFFFWGGMRVRVTASLSRVTSRESVSIDLPELIAQE
jgi:hypothetical protein